jgi:hypothetical protein
MLQSIPLDEFEREVQNGRLRYTGRNLLDEACFIGDVRSALIVVATRAVLDGDEEFLAAVDAYDARLQGEGQLIQVARELAQHAKPHDPFRSTRPA